MPGLSYDQLLALVDSLLEQVSRLESLVLQLQKENASLHAENDALRTQVRELMDKLNKDSHNSSKPPSSDGLAKKPCPKSLRLPGTRPSGGQMGHPGSTLRMSETPDQVIIYAPDLCILCGASLEAVPGQTGERRQVFDIPPVALQVTEHVSEIKACPHCGTSHRGVFPPSVKEPVQYGERIKAAAVYLYDWQLLPSERTTKLLTDLFGCSLSEGILFSARKHCEQALLPITEQIKSALQRASLAHFDETGQRVAGRLRWLHVAGTEDLTYYATHDKRGRTATDEIGILPRFTGRAIHDAYNSYQCYDCLHGLCNAHHLRELTFLAEENGQIWAHRMKALLIEIKAQVDHAIEQGMNALSESTLRAFEERYDRLIQDGYNTNPQAERTKRRGRVPQGKGRSLVMRLHKGRRETLAFMYDFSVPFDNNLAERDIRMMKVRQKVSGCFRTAEGAVTFGVIRGYISTMQKQGHNALTVLESIFQGCPLTPGFT